MTSMLFNKVLIFFIVIVFLIHSLIINKYKASQDRLEHSRVMYLLLSFLILSYSWFTFIKIDYNAPYLLLVMGYTFSFVGDFFNLKFSCIKSKVKFPVLYGILSFMVAQSLYISFFISVLSTSVLFRFYWFYLILFILWLIPAIIFKTNIYSEKRPKSLMTGAFIYGFFLSTMVSVVFAGALIRGGNWWYIFTGAIFFFVSDVIMGQTTIKGIHPVYEFQLPWITYLIAQGFLLFGFVI